MPMNQVINNIPDISFIDNLTLEQVQTILLDDYTKKYTEVSGKDLNMSRSDPMRLLINACSVYLYQLAEWIDRAGKQSLLKYSYGPFLDNLGALKGVKRKDSEPAKTTVRFSIQQARTSVVGVPVGTRVTDSNNMYFQTDEYAEITAGKLYVDVPCSCMTLGIIGNGLLSGEINVLVDPIPYVSSITNVTATTGGTDVESDENFAERIYLAPTNYSCAGPESAYEFYTKDYSSDISDVRVVSPSECEVDVYFVMENGELPSDEMVSRVADHLNNTEIKPMTDRVSVRKPSVTEYAVNFTYYINKENTMSVAVIQANVNNAVREYIEWQNSRIGRDINPDKLKELVMAAGVKRVDISAPFYSVIGSTAIAKNIAQTVSYGGLEDD